MTANLLMLLMLAEAVALATLYLLLKRLSWFTRRTWDEVPEFLRCLDLDAIEKLFDPEEEKEALSFGDFRRTQRARLALAREFIKRMQHNAMIVYQWAETEWLDMRKHRLEYEPELQARIEALHRESITFLGAARIALLQISLWSILHFDKVALLPLPSLARLRRPISVDLISAYQQAKQAAVAMADVYGEEQAEEIRRFM
jgi:hypothetical protein